MLTGPGGLLDRDKEPRWYRDSPVMADWQQAQFLLSVFFDLSSSRQYGAMGGIYSIPWHQVMYYADRLGLDHESAQALWLVIRDVDHRYVSEQNKKNAPKKRAPATPERVPVGRRTRSKPPDEE